MYIIIFIYLDVFKKLYRVSQGAKKNNQHVDFPSGHPPEYYPRLSLVNFAERTGCSSFRLIWPIEMYCGYFVAYIFFSIYTCIYIYIYIHVCMVRMYGPISLSYGEIDIDWGL